MYKNYTYMFIFLLININVKKGTGLKSLILAYKFLDLIFGMYGMAVDKNAGNIHF